MPAFPSYALEVARVVRLVEAPRQFAGYRKR